jgi:hypothetical protein
MKVKLMLFCGLILMGMTACNKDRVCVCTSTYTSSSGNVTTDVDANVTYTESTRREAVSHCQKSTVTNVSASGATSSQVMDCKLK